MASPKAKPILRPALDPAAAANEQVLADRERRILEAQPPPLDMGLNLIEKPPATCADFIDEWDRKAYGDPAPTIKKMLYGPDPLIDQCPELKAKIEQYGLYDYIEMTREAVLTKGAAAFPDKMLAKGARIAIAKFGKEAFADALCERLKRIPVREVEIDASDIRDPYILGGDVLRQTVDQYKRPGMSYRFFSERGLGLFGHRGYQIVKDPTTGEVVKAGTLILGEIRTEIAELRRQHFAAESEAEVREIEEAYREAIARPDSRFDYRGAKAEGVAAVGEGESVTAGASESEMLLGETRRAGVRLDYESKLDREGRSERRTAA